ncbi:pyrimidine nucleotide-sugar transmembrane transporter [Aureococcus anophagefferens]|nr:pyrimidine nucleotide-sugar transmembrane transporter [Aureococcus anophagefferens]
MRTRSSLRARQQPGTSATAARGGADAAVPWYASPMKRAKAISLAVLMVQNSALTLAMRYSRTRKTAHRYHPSEAVVMSEVVKLIISLALAAKAQEPRPAMAGRGLLARVADRYVGAARAHAEPGSYVLLVPAALYAVQNNLQYVAASNLEPAVFQVLYQMKVLTTAFFSVVLLKRELKPAQWSAIALLAAGLATVGSATTGPSAPKPGVNFAVGFAAVFAACCSSGFSSVYFERVVKQRSRPLPKAPPRGRVARDAPPPARKPISVWARNAQMATFSSTIAFTGALLKDGDAIRARGALAGFSPIVWCTVVLQAGGGLCTAAVIAYADNLLKGFATGGSMVISVLASHLFLDFHVAPTFVAGAAAVLGSIHLYSKA